jgi:hypothetical protein
MSTPGSRSQDDGAKREPESGDDETTERSDQWRRTTGDERTKQWGGLARHSAQRSTDDQREWVEQRKVDAADDTNEEPDPELIAEREAKREQRRIRKATIETHTKACVGEVLAQPRKHAAQDADGALRGGSHSGPEHGGEQILLRLVVERQESELR